MKKTPRILIDCSKLKHPNTGLYSFTYHLIRALLDSSERSGERLGGFYSGKTRSLLPDDIDPMRMCYLHRFFLPLPESVRVWHAIHQLTPYLPATGQKKLLTVHDLNFLYEKGGKRLKTSLARLQKNAGRVDRLVAISEFARKDLLEHIDTQGKPVDVIYPGCPVYRGPAEPLPYVPERPFLFTIGTLLEKKNFHVLPCLLKGNDFDLYIAGNYSPYADRIRQEAKKWGVADRVHILGAIREEEKQAYLQTCTAFVFPSIAEGFGIPVVEAMACGKPLFLSAHTSLPEIGGELAVYFNRAFDPEEMQREFQEGIQRFAAHTPTEALKKRAALFSWDRTALGYWKIYRELLES